MEMLKQTPKIAALLMGLLMLLSSCSEDDDVATEPEAEILPPIVLDCDYFKEDRILENDPQRPVDYIISCEAKVTKDLIIEPGVVLAFSEDASLILEKESSFKMEGTEDKPIILTGEVAEKGLWRGVLIESNKTSNSMKYVTIEYAGSKSASHRGDMYPAGLQIAMDGDVTIDHCKFQYCKDNGLYWTSTKYISITNSVFTKNDVPIKTRGNNQIKLYNNTNDYTGNTHDYVHMQFPSISNDNKKITWKKINVPYFITTRVYNRFDVDHAQLIIEPGTDIIMATAETHLRIRGDASITAVGTTSSPIVFRGENDVKASWGYILIQSGNALNEIGHVSIKNAGNSMGNIKAAVQIAYGSYLNIHNANFKNNAGYAVGMLYSGGVAWPVLDYDNIMVDNGKKFCKGANGPKLTNPNDPDSTN
ncbi:MAG: right-handed parallel beta-helix repeat-containing protein [Mesonia hippocampi]|uniref:right-handed parallel beta-helix repeat-containing protein n=1 Tax=Mesonia hippocampi TaxID=1628250 RepID=UPI003F990B43